MIKSLYQKLYEHHLVYEKEDEIPILYIDRHLIHEVTSPQAFNNLRSKGRKVRHTNKTFATMDHNVSTTSRDIFASGKIAYLQMQELIKNCEEFNIRLYDLSNPYQGIIHIISPEQGIVLPGMTIVCGDSHTSTHGAFGALSFGIGTSEVEHVLATQTIKQHRLKSMMIKLIGNLSYGITAKDLILAIIGKIGTYGGNGYVVEFVGNVISSMSMESRMTICNMAIEMGATSGLIAPDNITYNYLYNRKFSPKSNDWNQAICYWNTLSSDKDANFDKVITLDISNIEPQVTWGTNPSQVIAITKLIPSIESFTNYIERDSAIKALTYMGLKPGIDLKDIPIDKVFIGSCTNSRIEDLRAAAAIANSRRVSKGVQAIVVPGSIQVKKQAEKEGLDQIFIDAGFEWRLPGCSMCLAMNSDRLNPGERCASTSNRNFEGRQGWGGRTHLMSPSMAAAAAITGHFTDIRELNNV